jgi:hypothetical protein
MPPGFEPHQVLVWHWIILASIFALPLLIVARLFGGLGSSVHPHERALLVAVLCGALAVIATGISLLAVAERRPITNHTKARAKALRAEISSEVRSTRVVAARFLRELGTAGAGVDEAWSTAPGCGFGDATKKRLQDAGGIAFLTNASGDQLCLVNASSSTTLVNRADREYFERARQASAGEQIGPVEIINQQTGERSWVFGARLPRRRVRDAAKDRARNRSFPLENSTDRVAEFVFLALPLRPCAAVRDGEVCLLVNSAGRIIASQPPAYSLSGLRALELVSPEVVLASRMTGRGAFTEKIRWRGEKAIASISPLGPKVPEVHALAVVPFTARFRSIQHALLSIAKWSFWIWMLPLLTLALYGRFAPKSLVDVLLPQRAPRDRYSRGALTLTIFGALLATFALLELDPQACLLLALLSALGSPLLGFAVLGAEPVGERGLWRRLADPDRVCRWYLPFFTLGLGTVAAWSAHALDRPPGVILEGAFLGPLALGAGMAPSWSGTRPGAGKALRRAGALFGPLSALSRWFGRNYRAGYVVSAAAVLWFLAGQPAVLTSCSIFETLRLADQHVLADRNGGAGASEELPLPPRRTGRLLAARFDLDGEKRIAALQQRELAGTGVVWRPTSIAWPTLVSFLLWSASLLGWWAFSSRTFGWGAESAGERADHGEFAEEEAERRRSDDLDLLRVVARRRIPSWRLSPALRRQLRKGLVENKDGLALTPAGRKALSADGSGAGSRLLPSQELESSPSTVELTESKAPSPAIPGWAYLLVAAPVAIWLLGQPALLANVALWTSTLLSATRSGNRVS